MEQITIKNEAGEVWVSGKRGKPPAWVSNHPEYLAYKAEKATEIPQVTVKAPLVPYVSATPTKKEPEVVEDPSAPKVLHYWRWFGVESEMPTQSQCYVAAFSAKEAIAELNSTFKIFPVSPSEFQYLWNEIPATDALAKVPGAYQMKGEIWEKRQRVLTK